MPELTCSQWMNEYRRCIAATEDAHHTLMTTLKQDLAGKACDYTGDGCASHLLYRLLDARQAELEAGRAFMKAWDEINGDE